MKIQEDRYPDYDVAVIGGGMAGITAAIASARNGAKTIMIEKNGWLGGIGIVGATGLHSFFNIFNDKFICNPTQCINDNLRIQTGYFNSVLIKI